MTWIINGIIFLTFCLILEQIEIEISSFLKREEK